MRAKKQPAPLEQRKTGQYKNRQPQFTEIQRDSQALATFGLRFQKTAGHFHTLKKIKSPQTDSQEIKSWTIDRLVEYFFDGQRTNQHKLALAFWSKSGRLLKNV